MFQELNLKPHLCPDPRRGEAVLPWRRLEYWTHPAKFLAHHQLPIEDDDEIFMLHGLRFEGDIVSSVHAAVRMDEVFAKLPPPGAPRREATGDAVRRPPRTTMQKLLEMHPWITMDDLVAQKVNSKGVRLARKCGFAHGLLSAEVGEGDGDDAGSEAEISGDGGHGDSADDSDGEAVVPEEGQDGGDADVDFAAAAAYATERLFELREEWRPDVDVFPDEFFHTTVMGGKWTFANRGVAADAVATFARAGVAQDWCRRFQWPRQRSYAFGRYHREGAHQLAREFARFSDYLIRLSLDAGDDFFHRGPHSWIHSVRFFCSLGC